MVKNNISLLYIKSKGGIMPKVSAKRQITLPVSQCVALGIEPGDEVESFVAHGQLTIVKKKQGAAKGILKHVQGNPAVTDEESLESAL
jgi:bifunctional DNA-binding transcriptional regulator/antitoxin component of YhaV-PrlF toxin-antitoxin module